MTVARLPGRRLVRLGLRSRILITFAGGALVLSSVISVGAYLVARDFAVGQRERNALVAATADAAAVSSQLLDADLPVSDALAAIAPPAGVTALLNRGDDWYSTSLPLAEELVPAPSRQMAADGSASVGWTAVDGVPAVVVALPMPEVGADFYEIAASAELDSTLRTIGAVLLGFAVLTTLGGAALGRWVAGRVLRPLTSIGATATDIAAGKISTRLAPSDDPELHQIVTSFNQMVDALAQRIDRDARFHADVSHELRSPLTTLSTSVELLRRRRDELAPSSREAVDLITVELGRFRSMLDNLLELGRLDASAQAPARDRVDLLELVRRTLTESGRSLDCLRTEQVADPVVVEVDKQSLHRALRNLFDNADVHGGGLVAVHVRPGADAVVVDVDDDGPGVPPDDRERVFERFVRAGSRGSRTGAGLGLSLVAETVRNHGGHTECVSAPSGGARFRVVLPRCKVAPGEVEP